MNNYIKKELVNISEIHVIRFLFNNILNHIMSTKSVYYEIEHFSKQI